MRVNCFTALSQSWIFAAENEGLPGGTAKPLSLGEVGISALADQKAENKYLIKVMFNEKA